ncbi:MAG: hypothetical protein RDU13_03225 [Elusimicrobiales bacterium]|nr:hypothetical protein [Elusimicrobiales bacterium]
MFWFAKKKTEMELCLAEMAEIGEELYSKENVFKKQILPHLIKKIEKNVKEIPKKWNYNKFTRKSYLKNEISHIAFKLIDNGDCYKDTGVLNEDGEAIVQIFIQMLGDLEKVKFMDSNAVIESKAELEKAISHSTSPENKKKVVAACLSELKKIEKDFMDRGWIFFELIKESAIKSAKDQNKTFWSTLEGYPIKTIALLLVSNAIMDSLVSGEYHIYRGKLSMAGEGLKNGYVYINSELIKLGYQTKESAQKDLHSLESQIRQMG